MNLRSVLVIQNWPHSFCSVFMNKFGRFCNEVWSIITKISKNQKITKKLLEFKTPSLILLTSAWSKLNMFYKFKTCSFICERFPLTSVNNSLIFNPVKNFQTLWGNFWQKLWSFLKYFLAQNNLRKNLNKLESQIINKLILKIEFFSEFTLAKDLTVGCNDCFYGT